MEGCDYSILSGSVCPVGELLLVECAAEPVSQRHQPVVFEAADGSLVTVPVLKSCSSHSKENVDLSPSLL